jgi:NhaP-type Na+/H+ or K+/H+ antiporter
MVLGSILGMISSLGYKYLHFKPNVNAAEVCVFLCWVYVAFLVAESVEFSGIISVFFAGIAMRRYTNKNLCSKESIKKVSFTLKLLSQTFETACFVLLGLSVFNQSTQHYNVGFSILTFALITIGRLQIYPLLMMVSLT